MGVSRTGIADVESGKLKGTVKFIAKLAEVSGKSISYWMDENIKGNYKTYEALDVLLDAMVDSGMIGSDGKIGERETKLIVAVLEKEIALKMERKQN